MKNIRILVVLLLLAIAAPLAIHYRAWSLDSPVAKPAAAIPPMQPSTQSASTGEVRETLPQPLEAKTLNYDLPGAYFDLPGASSSLPLLSVIGFGVFLGGLISALRTRPA